MRRRELIAALGGAIAGSGRLAIGQSRAPRVAVLWLGPAGSDGTTRNGLEAGLRELGYREGQNIVVTYSYADGSEKRLAELAAAAVAEQPDVIVTPGSVVTRAVKRLTTTIPILSVSADPVGFGFVASLSRPGGNITGLTTQVGPDLAGKWLQLLVEIAPGARHITYLTNAGAMAAPAELVAMRAAAGRLGGNFTLDECAIGAAAELPSAFATIRRAKADALVVDSDPLILSNRAAIIAFAAEHRLPAVYGLVDFVGDGGLMAYSASIFDIYRRAASYIDRILKGAKPADLPVEQPTKYALASNLKTANALGLTVSPSLLAQADEVIE